MPEPTSRSGRVLIVSAATLSLVLIGMLALSMTPDRLDPSGQAVGSGVMITLGPPVVVGAGTVAGASAAAPATTLRSARTIDSLVATLPLSPPPTVLASPTVVESEAVDTVSPVPVPVSSGWVDADLGSEPGSELRSELATPSPPSEPAVAALAVLTTSPYPVVTPFGVDGMAVTTGRAVGDRTDTFAVSLPSGEVTDARIVAVTGDVAVVELCDCNTAYQQYQMAPDGDTVPEQVVVMADGADLVVEPTSLAAMRPQEGAPVMDLTGRVIGLYTYGPHGDNPTGAVLGVANVGVIVDDLPPPTTEAVATSGPITLDATTTTVLATDGSTTSVPPLPTSTTLDMATTATTTTTV